MSVRISATDWAENGISEEDVIYIAIAFKNAGADIINVSTGNTVAYQKPLVGRMWQTPFSDTGSKYDSIFQQLQQVIYKILIKSIP
jgi:anthraniloyl-CoA monooxygenase